MLFLRRFALILFVSYFVFPCFAEKPGLVVVSSQSKELKRAAHRLRIPAEQMKHAREALQEATDLAKQIKPCPFDQIPNLVQMWDQVNRPKAKRVVESFISDLRSETAECPDFPCYQRATSVAMSLMQSNFDYEKTIQQLRSWPDPKPALGDAAVAFRNTLETQVKNQAISRLAYSEPEKALKLLSETGNTDAYNYTASGQIAQAFMNAGKKEDALRLIDQGISKFNQNTADPRMLQEFENFVRMTASTTDSTRTTAAIGQLITALTNQSASVQCNATLRAGDISLALTCAESRILNLIRNLPMRPAFMMKTLDSVPGLKSKLDGVGGIDGLYGGGMGGSTPVTISAGPPAGQRAPISVGVTTGPTANLPALIQELKGKAESDPAVARGKLKDLDVDALLNLAMNASYQDPDLAGLAIEMAQPMLSAVEPLQKRASTLQNLIRASRQVDGEVDQELLRSGFILADQIRQELSEKTPTKVVPINSYMTAGADQLEVFLVSELSRDSFDSAISYARSLENNTFKLTCLIQIVQSQAQSNF
jgi:tetratricopeptide (TPR) repeat protein